MKNMGISKVLLGLISVRILCTICVQTWFVPDETWQSVEVAHNLSYGHGWMTWEWKEGLRSYSYPSMFMCLFWILKILNLDFPLLLIQIPRLFSAILFAYGDYCAFRLATTLYGTTSAQWTLRCIMSSWFLAYCAPRTLTSCVEMILLSISLRVYPWHKEKESPSSKYLYWTGIACCVRPTILLAILPFYLRHFYLCAHKWDLLKGTVVKAIIVLLISTAVDSICYGKLVFTPLNFLAFNVLSSQASFYGSHPWHWYWTQGIPVVCSFHLPFIVFGSIKKFNSHKSLLIPCIFLVSVYSFCGHKEFRFILPILPLLLCIAGDFLSRCMRNRSSSTLKIVYLWLIIPNLITFIYMGVFHQRGALDVVNYLRNSYYSSSSSIGSVLFLTPCHSTPLYSHLHVNLPVRFLTCEPNLEHKSNYQDEAEIFFDDPQSWLMSYLSNSPSPDCIVMFDSLMGKLQSLMNQHYYQLTESFFYSHFPEGNRGNYLNVYCKSSVNMY